MVTRADCSVCQRGVRADRTNIHPDTQALFSRRMTWKRTDHEPPTVNSHPAIAAGHPPPPSRACTPPPGPPVTANLPTRQPQRFGAWTTMGPGGGGGARRRGCLRTPPPRPGLHAGGWRFGITVCPGSGGDAGNRTVIPPPPGICGMAVHSRGLMGSMHRRCFSSSTLEHKLVDRTSHTPRQTGHTSSSRRGRARPTARPCRHCLLHVDHAQIPQSSL